MARSQFLRALHYLDIEEKILNASAIMALVGVFMPWFGGEWSGESQMWNGFGFYTAFIGILIFLGQVVVLGLTLLPMLGYPLLRPSLRDLVRFIIGAESVLLLIIVYSVFRNISFDFAQVDIRFGVHFTIVGCIVESLYAFLRIHQQRTRQVRELFHHPEDVSLPQSEVQAERPVLRTAPMDVPLPPPPPPPSPEDDNLFSSRIA